MDIDLESRESIQLDGLRPLSVRRRRGSCKYAKLGFFQRKYFINRKEKSFFSDLQFFKR